MRFEYDLLMICFTAIEEVVGMQVCHLANLSHVILSGIKVKQVSFNLIIINVKCFMFLYSINHFLSNL